MYLENRYDLGAWIEVEKTYSGRYGKRIMPAKKKKPTPEDVAQTNINNASKMLRRKIALNFRPGDYHMVLTYRGEPPTPEEAAKRLSNFFLALRRWYRNQDQELKYIKVTEYKRQRIHHHVIINQIPDSLQKIREIWPGGIHPSLLYEDGRYKQLADYLVKETRLTFKDMDAPSKLRYSTSRNLLKPEKRTRVMKANEWAETPVPPQGYWIPKDSIVDGISEKTGRRYQYYTLVPLGTIPIKEQRADQERVDSNYIKPRSRRTTCRSG